MLRNLREKISTLSSGLSLATPRAELIVSWQYVLLGILTFFACYYGLAAYPVLDMNEGLYAEIAREMITQHHWIIPYLNNVPYLEKPPLLYWLIAFNYKLFGVNAFAARLVPCTMTALTAWSLFYFGHRLQLPRVGWIAAIILLTSLVFIIIGRVIFFDMLLTFCFSTSLLAFYLWYQQRRAQDLYLAYSFLALAILTKGLMAIVFMLPIVVVFLWLVKADRAIYRDLCARKALILFGVIVLPWHIAALFSQWGFFYEYFINNQILRFFNARIPHDYHTGPIYYYLPRVLAYVFPWSLVLAGLCPWPLRGQRSTLQPLTIFLWAWLLICLVLFSLSGDKGDYYMVIAMPAFAWILAAKIDQWFSEDKARWLTLIFGVSVFGLVAVGILALLFYSAAHTDLAGQTDGHLLPVVLQGPLQLLIVVLLVYGITGLYLISKNAAKPLLPFLLLAGLIFPNLLFYLTVKERTQLAYSQYNLARYVRAQYEYRPTYLYQNFAAYSSFVFYNGEPSIVIDNQSADLAFGATTKAGKSQFITMAEFSQIAKQHSVYVVMEADKLQEFLKALGNNSFCTVQRNGQVILLSNAAQDCQASIGSLQGQEKPLNIPNLPKNQTRFVPVDS